MIHFTYFNSLPLQNTQIIPLLIVPFLTVYLGGHEPEWGTQSSSAWKGLEHQTWDGSPVHLCNCQICKWENELKCCAFINLSVLYNCSRCVEVSWHSTRFSRMSSSWSCVLWLALSFLPAHPWHLSLSCSPLFMLEYHIFNCNFDFFFFHCFPSCATI